LAATVRRAESLGYDTFVLPDHLDGPQLSPIPALATIAEMTDTMRIGTYVLCNDFHHPVILARELATLDELSRGRLDVGIGAGWIRYEYENAGIKFDSGGERLRRLQDSLIVIKAMFGEDPVTIDTDHYQVRNQIGSPRPVQRPHPPFLLGGGGRRMLTWAAGEADIVSIIPAAAPGGGLRISGLRIEALQRQIGWVREAAGARFDDLTINILLFDLIVTDDPRTAARKWLQTSARTEYPHPEGYWVLDAELSEDEVLASPYLAFGTHEQVAEHLREVIVSTGVSYFSVFPHMLESFGPILELLKS
jgi:probable F420-dependent oxidoreductase